MFVVAVVLTIKVLMRIVEEEEVVVEVVVVVVVVLVVVVVVVVVLLVVVVVVVVVVAVVVVVVVVVIVVVVVVVGLVVVRVVMVVVVAGAIIVPVEVESGTPWRCVFLVKLVLFLVFLLVLLGREAILYVCYRPPCSYPFCCLRQQALAMYMYSCSERLKTPKSGYVFLVGSPML